MDKTSNLPYIVLLDKKTKEEIPAISKDRIEQFKKDLKKYSEDLHQ